MAFVRDEDIEALIVEVEKRPALYDKTLKDYINVNLKKKLWEEICSIIVRNWKTLTAESRTRAVIDIQRKWQSLRNCFSRELRNQKKESSGLLAKKRRKYMYFENLLFLMSTIEHRELNIDENTEDENEHFDDDTTDSKKNAKIEAVIASTYEPPLVDTSEFEQESNRKEENEDVHFALSLVPTISSLDEGQKIEAKIQILSILKTLKFGTSNRSNTCQPPTLTPITNTDTPLADPTTSQDLLDYSESFNIKPSQADLDDANLYQRKWKSLRDSYSRERAKQKKESSSTTGKFRKKYKYFDQLSFLETGLKPTEDNNTLSDDEQIAIEDIKIEHDVLDQNPESDNFQDQRSTQKRKRDEVGQGDFLETLRAKYCHRDEENRVDDDDKLFLLSLHNDLKTLPDYIKLSVKSQIIGILSIAKQAAYPPKTYLQEFPSSSLQYQSPRSKDNDNQQQDNANPSVLSPADEISNSSNISNELFS